MKLIETDKILQKFKLKEFPDPELINLKYPVLLCHGYGAVATLSQPSPLYNVSQLLRRHGVIAFAPNIVSYARIETRAPQWADRIKTLVERHEIEKLNIITHSMGGLDLRFALAETGISPNIASLTTISTPHKGTSLAEYVLDAPNIVREKMAALFDWFGNNIYPEKKSDSAGAITQLTRTYVETEFNPRYPLPEHLPCFSYSASVGKGTETALSPIFRYQNGIVFENEGLNDSFVSIKSADWGEHLGTVHISHFEQMNLRPAAERRNVVEDFWLDVVKKLAEKGY